MSLDTFMQIAPIAALLAFGAWFGMGLQRFVWRMRRGDRRKHRPSYERTSYDSGDTQKWAPQPVERTRTQDAAEQLRIVMKSEFSARPLLNQSEARVFEELCQIVSRCKPGWRVMAQVSLGEILRSKDTEAFWCVNSKRVDMLLVDEACRPRHAIEYQGDGHHQGNAAARDAVKKEALRRAGIGYHEVVAGKTTPADLRTFIESLIAKADASGR